MRLPRPDLAAPPRVPLPATVSPETQADLSGLMSLAIGVVVVVALYVAREVLVPIALAILLSFVLAPVVRLLRRACLPRGPAVVLAVFLALGIILSLGGVIAAQVGGLVAELPRYAYTIEEKIGDARQLMVSELSGRLGWLRHRITTASKAPVPSSSPDQVPVEEAPKPPEVIVHQPDPTSLEIAERIVAPVISPLATTAIVFIVSIFILMQQADLRDRLIRLFGMQDRHRTTRALDDAAQRLSRYLLTQLGLNTCFGVIVTLGLFLIGLPHPLLWGTLAGLLRFVPYFGAVISGLLPTALAAAIDPGWSLAFWTAGLFLVSETVMGQFIDPLVYGKSTGLSPVSVVIAAIFWTWMWGPIGLILSMPLTVCLVVLGRHVKRLEFLDILMGDRPALTPVEGFYQRILANDPDEAQNYSENLLKDRSLSSYYDEVAVRGLQLVATDAERGVLSAAQLVRIGQSMESLVEELGDFDDAVPASAKLRSRQIAGLEAPEPDDSAPTADMEPDPVPEIASDMAPTGRDVGAEHGGNWSGAGPVLCISGRGPLDDVASAMLAQLLGKNGLPARAEPHDVASRETIAALAAEGVATVCIASLETNGNPSHMRYLVRRLRRHLPQTRILVGMFPLEESIDERFRAAVGADGYASSLSEAVNLCLTEADSRRAEGEPGAFFGAAVTPAAA